MPLCFFACAKRTNSIPSTCSTVNTTVQISRKKPYMSYTIENARLSDRDPILQVMKAFNMHHVPSAEMAELDLNAFFVARYHGRVIGAAGYTFLSQTEGKTTLMAVLPEYAGFGIGKALQHRRMEEMHLAGARTVLTNADRPETIVWYKKHFGYRQIGTLKKLCSFGHEAIDHWTTLETDLDAYFRDLEANQRSRSDYIAANDAHPLAPFPPLIINVCLTGMVPTRAQNPHLPVTCEEIIKDAIECHDTGASMVHLHARDAEGNPTPDVKLYDTIIRGIRKERPDLICAATTSGRHWNDFERRAAVLYLDEESRPDMASLTTGSMNFLTGASVNTITMIEQLAMAMKEQGVMPELEVFDRGMINLVKYLERNRIIGGTKYCNILLGNINSSQATIRELAGIVNDLPQRTVWAAAGLGQFQLPMNLAGMVAGGHVRVGIEDAVYYDYQKTVPAANKQLVDRITRIAAELQRPIATAAQARKMLGLPQARH